MGFPIDLNRRDRYLGVNAAASFDDMVKYHEVILFEREAGMPNWLLNMEVVCFGRAYRERTLMKSRAGVSQTLVTVRVHLRSPIHI